MTNHTRRQFLGFIASLLTLVDAVRRFFKPPEVVVDPKTRLITGSCKTGKTRTDGPYYIDDPLIRKRAMLKLLQEKGHVQLNCTGPDWTLFE